MNRINRSPEELLKIRCIGKSLSDFSIVYNEQSHKGEYFVALDLRYHLFYDTGCDVPVKTDAEEESEYEILIGETSRGGVAVPAGHYRICVDGNKVHVVSDRLAGYLEAASYLTATLLPQAAESEILTDGFSYLHAIEQDAPAKRGEFRMLLQNIWGVDWGTELIKNRDRYAAAFLLSYQPDLLFINEYWTVMRNHGRFQKLMEENGYTEVVAENWTRPNVIPIFYKSGEWRQLECRIYDLRGGDESKTITLAVLQHIASGKIISCCDTHLQSNWNCSFEVGTVRRVNNVRMLEPLLKDLLARYPNAPFLFGADCNCYVDSEPFRKLLSLGLTDAHDASPVTDEKSSCHGYPLFDQTLDYYVEPTPHWNSGSYAGAIDHILFRGNLIPRVYANVVEQFPAMYSDHYPVLFEFDVPAADDVKGDDK